jgi:hypothetical protein
MLVLGGEVKA